MSGFVRSGVGAATGVVGAAVALPATYLAVLSLAAHRHPRPTSAIDRGEPARLLVLVPAHNEEALIGRCLDSLRRQDFPQHAYRVAVVADNCRDATAEIAAAMGADVLVRDDPAAPGKGRALRWAIDRCLASDEGWEAAVIIDADSVVDEQFLRWLGAELRAGADAVQADYVALVEDDGARAQLRYAAFLLFHRVRFSGRGALGLPCNLVGNGMLLTRQLLNRVPWDAYSGAEDLEYSLTLRLSDVRPIFAPKARISAPVATGGPAGHTQRTRWEGGRISLVATRLPELLRACLLHRRWDLWDAAMDLATPPIGILTTSILGGSAVGGVLRWLGIVRTRHLMPWGIAMVAVPVHVLGGMAAGGAPPQTYRALLAAPALVASEIRTRLALLRNNHAAEWRRTQRPDEHSSD